MNEKPSASMRRMWFNQPSMLHPLHELHGIRVLACPDADGTMRAYFLSGDVVDMQVPCETLDEGWPEAQTSTMDFDAPRSEDRCDATGRSNTRTIFQDGDRFYLKKGRYAVVPRDSLGRYRDPRPGARAEATLDVVGQDRTCVTQVDGLDVLMIPLGKDDGGCPGRTMEIGTQTIVAFESLAIVPLHEAEAVPHSSLPGISAIAMIEMVSMGTMMSDEDDMETGVSIDPGNDAEWITIDSWSKGAFSIGDEIFDMMDDFIAKAFDYGSPSFNAGLGEIGFTCDVDAIRARAESMGGEAGSALLARLPHHESTAIARYAVAS